MQPVKSFYRQYGSSRRRRPLAESSGTAVQDSCLQGFPTRLRVKRIPAGARSAAEVLGLWAWPAATLKPCLPPVACLHPPRPDASAAGCLALNSPPGRKPWTSCPSMLLPQGKGSCEPGSAPSQPFPRPCCCHPVAARVPPPATASGTATRAATSCGAPTCCYPSCPMWVAPRGGQGGGEALRPSGQALCQPTTAGGGSTPCWHRPAAGAPHHPTLCSHPASTRPGLHVV